MFPSSDWCLDRSVLTDRLSKELGDRFSRYCKHLDPTEIKNCVTGSILAHLHTFMLLLFSIAIVAPVEHVDDRWRMGILLQKDGVDAGVL